MNKIEFSIAVKVCIILLFSIYLIISNNKAITIYSFVSLFFIIYLLWRPTHPFILVFCLSYQWVQVFSNIVYADFLDLTVDNLYNTSNGANAIILSLIGLIILALIISIVGKRIKALSLQSANDIILKYNFRKILYLFISLSIIEPILIGFGYNNTSILQLIFVFSNLKWLLFILMIFRVVLTGSHVTIVIIVLIIEFILGFSGYFSSFKTPVLYAVITLLTFKQIIRFKEFSLALLFTIFFASVLFIWQGVKPEYRNILSGGSRQQVVVISTEEALNTIYNLVLNFTPKQKEFAVRNTFDRIAYTRFFSNVMDRIPTYLNYENGNIWLNSLKFTFLPRFLFPNKGSLDASAKTNKYTGLNFTLASGGTSVSMGYFVDSYIDFGPLGMFIPLIFIGTIVGLIFLYFLKNSPDIIFGYALVTTIFFDNFAAFEIDGTKLIGGFVVSFAYNLLLLKTIYPKIIKWLKTNNLKQPSNQSIPYVSGDTIINSSTPPS